MFYTFVALQAEGAPAATGGWQSFLQIFVTMAPIFLIFYLLIFRPMRSRQKKLDRMIKELKNGDKVITNGGVYGTIAGVKDNTFLLKISDQVKIEIAKNAIAGLQNPPDGSIEK